ncbi:MAG TPA: hypothetical protein VKD91_11750 [Pyrinomonadaceae bacterium]|nr:hypothetical protein [Pyrinomonadaceae bacterium]
MSIQKKSLISTLKTAKKANVASDAKGEKIASMRAVSTKQFNSKTTVGSARMFAKSLKHTKALTLKSAKAVNTLKVVL